MASDHSSHVLSMREPSRFFLRAGFDALARRFPFLAMIFVAFASNLAGSFFNFFYNTRLIVEQEFNPTQKAAFWDVAAPIYNVIAYPPTVIFLVVLMWPAFRCLRRLRRGEPVTAAELELGQRRVVNLPAVQLIVNSLAWLPGMVYFPAVVTYLGGTNNAGKIWEQFIISFAISTLFTTAQTFFMLQGYLTSYLYPDLFKTTRPENVQGAWIIPFRFRLILMWAAIALAPLIALLTVALNLETSQPEHYWFAIGLVIVSAASGGFIFWLVAQDLWRWIQLQTKATARIGAGDLETRIDQPRGDEWGRLTNRFNDMAASLSQAWQSHETLGQLVSPEVRDQILRKMQGFEVQLQVITVLFVDIRGFTPRCAGQPPERVGALLNRFLTLALCSIEEKGGYVNKFLGDGVMALFGATHTQDNHADLAVASAREMLERLKVLNAELAAQGEKPLVIGIGIHTGEALVGCFGAMVQGEQGQSLMRREFTAIGETVNLCQRIEQLTKKCGGPILISDATRAQLNGKWTTENAGPQEVAGAPAPVVVHVVVVG